VINHQWQVLPMSKITKGESKHKFSFQAVVMHSVLKIVFHLPLRIKVFGRVS
jgi:hypothetical protein